MNAQQYAVYLASNEWRAVRSACLARYGHRCQVCGCTSWRRLVDVHHLHYRNVGNEKPEDLVPLCCDHHALIHNQPDGHDLPVLRRLQRECTEDRWDDPLPADVRERGLRLRDGFVKVVFCKQCASRYDYDPEGPFCPYCGLGAHSASNSEQSVAKQNADFLGFTDAKLLHEAPSWTKAGSR